MKKILLSVNSEQITLIDTNEKSHLLYAMSTFIFRYGGNKASKKLDSLQVADYYQISKKSSRPTIRLVFKVEENKTFKELKIKGYKKRIRLENFHA